MDFALSAFGCSLRGMSAHRRAGLRCINQPVAQSPIKPLTYEDLGFLGSINPRYRVESIFAPFMQQAEIFRPDGCMLSRPRVYWPPTSRKSLDNRAPTHRTRWRCAADTNF